MKSCFFFGHRDAPESILPALEAVVERHIRELDVREFIVGGYGSFDRLAARAAVRAKLRHPQITVLRLLPYHPALRPVEVPEGFDNTFYPPGLERVLRRLAIARANRYMVGNVDHVVAYVWKSTGNTRKLLGYARERERRGLLGVTSRAK